jgi:ketosteroid isomerase-like protein
MTRIVDHPTVVYLVLGIAVFALAVAWWMTRKRAYAFGVGVGAVLVAVLWLVSTFVQSDAKQIEQNIRDMGSGVEANDLDRVFGHIAGDFSVGSMDKSAFRRYAERFLRLHHVTGIVVWDYEPGEVSRADRTALVNYKVKAHGIEDAQGVPFYNCRATFVLDADGQWRLRTFQLFLPTVDPARGEPIPLPF